MPAFLNPPSIGDFTPTGVSLGASTDVFVHAAGIALDPATGLRWPEAETIADEVRICLRNVETILAEAGLTLRDVVKTSCYLREADDRPEFIEAYRAAFEPGPYPVRCTFVLGLASNARVQIEATAVRPDAA